MHKGTLIKPKFNGGAILPIQSIWVIIQPPQKAILIMWIFTMSTNDIASMSVCGMKMSVTFKDMMATKTHTDTQNLLVNVISRGFIATHFPEVACKWFAFHSPQYFQLTKSLLRKKKKRGNHNLFQKTARYVYKACCSLSTVPFGIVQALSVSLSPHILAGKGRRALSFRLFLPAGCLTFMFYLSHLLRDLRERLVLRQFLLAVTQYEYNYSKS